MLRLTAITLASLLWSAIPSSAAELAAVDQLLDRITRLEQDFVDGFRTRTALVETYIQEMGSTPAAGEQSARDHYYLGRMEGGVKFIPLAARAEEGRSRIPFLRNRSSAFVPEGFVQMVLIDIESFNRQNYDMVYIRREFLGEVRCLVFEVAPIDKKAVGRFIGRIWVEDRDFHIVRFNGTYTHSSPSKLYFHFDSWRVNVGLGDWVPAFIYVEESQPLAKSQKFPRFKAQTRLWGYNVGRNSRSDELASIAIEAERRVNDPGAASEVTPLESQRSWERQAETNIIDRLEKSGLLAQTGSVEGVLNTVVNNLIASNNLSVDATCRVLLTTPLETFSVGRTIVVSRGLIDVLPDEASLAMALAGELAHIALGHRTDTNFAFYDRTMQADAELLNQLRLGRSEAQLTAAGVRAFEILSQSPYQEKLGNAGLFLKALASRAPQLPNLIRANLGDQLANPEGIVRMQALAKTGPALEENKLDQIAALPLGSRIRLDPWTNQITLLKAKPVSLLSARDKLPFEITPFMIPLARAASPAEQDPAGNDPPVQPER